MTFDGGPRRGSRPDGQPRQDLELPGVLDEMAARAVPAWEVTDVHGWLARYTPGVAARRVNSVWPREHDSRASVEKKLAAVERLYADRELPTRFQVGPASAPAGLDRALERRGYEAAGETSVARCDLARVAGAAPSRGTDVTIDLAQTARWSATWQASLALSEARLAASTLLFGRLTNPVAFATVSVDGAPAGVGMGVLDGAWLGIFNMATLPARQRRGVASAALTALARWAGRGGAEAAYLQVDRSNLAARALYRTAGFQTAYRYTYRTLGRHPEASDGRAIRRKVRRL